MKAKDIWLGTMKFNWIKLGVGLGFDLVALILLIVFCAIGAILSIPFLLKFYTLRDKDVQIMSKYNNGEISYLSPKKITYDVY